MMPERERETFASTWGAVLAAAGAAIGLGNIWRFPYMMGRYGGAAFLVIYLLVALSLGVPGLMVEWALGRHTRRGPLGAFQKVGMPGGALWSLLLLTTVALASSYYVVVIGWLLYYAARFPFGDPISQPELVFGELIANWPLQMVCVVLTAGLACWLPSFGVRQGIEKISRWVLPLFFLVFLVLIARSLTLPGAEAGLRYYLVPRWEDFRGTTLLAATGQAYFSLSLGGTFMVIYGSYLRAEERLPRNALFTAFADSAAAFLAGLVIVPAVFAFQIDMASGPPLLFVAMPGVFQRLPFAGEWLGFLFFGAVFLMGILSLVAAYEVLVAALLDRFGWERRKALTLVFLTQVGLSVPAALSLNYLSMSDLVWGTTMQPVGALLAVGALAWSLDRSEALAALGGRDWKWRCLYFWTRFGIPPAILGTLVYGWWTWVTE